MSLEEGQEEKGEEMKKGKKGHGHTGHIRHPHMTSLLKAVSGKDPHADPTFHRANAAHDMHEGMCPTCEYGNEGGGMEQGGGGMSENGEGY